MSMQELLKIVRYSNLFDLNHLMDAIDSINDETRTSTPNNNNNNSNTNTNTTNSNTTNEDNSTTDSIGSDRSLFLTREKNYRGRLSKKKIDFSLRINVFV